MLRSVRAIASSLFIAALLGADPVAATTVLCDANCLVNGAPPTHQELPFDFGLGLRAEANDSIDLDISGSLYIFGDITTDGGDLLFEAVDRIEVQTSITFLTNGGDITLIAGGARPVPPITPGTRSPTDAGGGVVLVSAAVVASGVLEFEGDVFLDLAGITLSSLSVHAGQDIVISRLNPMVTPEPGTLLMLGCGLGFLALRRDRRGPSIEPRLRLGVERR